MLAGDKWSNTDWKSSLSLTACQSCPPCLCDYHHFLHSIEIRHQTSLAPSLLHVCENRLRTRLTTCALQLTDLVLCMWQYCYILFCNYSSVPTSKQHQASKKSSTWFFKRLMWLLSFHASVTGIMASAAEPVVWSMNEVTITMAPRFNFRESPDEKITCNNNSAAFKFNLSWQWAISVEPKADRTVIVISYKYCFLLLQFG